MPTTLRSLTEAVAGAVINGAPETSVGDLAYDSRTVTQGSLFFCISGHVVDGHAYAAEAIARGAIALVVERPLAVEAAQIVVPRVRDAIGPMAATFFGHPSTAFPLVGVTGTNGKTTSVYMLRSVFAANDWMPGLISNIERRIGDETLPVDRNTPEAVDLQRLLARMRDAGVRAATMEVTSEGIAEGRVEGTRYACAVFTNLTQDHLNYHGTMEAYFEAKARMFGPDMADRAAINIDDAWGRRLASTLRIPAVTFAIDEAAEVRARDVVLDAHGSAFTVEVGGRSARARVPLPARYNVANALAVIAAAHAVGIELDVAVDGIAAVGGVPGRLERIDAGQDFTVIVDYAHTPDSLENVLHAAREFTPHGARLIVVFGCGGDRDRGKRPLMGRVGVSLADLAIITSDNPRSEEPLAIIREVEEGARDAAGAYELEVDRREAIAAAVRGARAGDVVVIAGKGHETGQQFAHETVPFDDRAVARRLLEELVPGRPS